MKRRKLLAALDEFRRNPAGVRVNAKGMAKAYQVRQVIHAVERLEDMQ